MTEEQRVAAFLGDDTARYVAMVDALALQSLRTRYLYTEKQQFERIVRNDPARGMQIFWQEILGRSHLTAVTGILRSRRWISSVVAACEANNLLAFAAAFRGLIESTADAVTALESVPPTLARYHGQIVRVLSGKSKTGFFVEHIEDHLIHFSYARHLTKGERELAPLTHAAKQIREYIQILERGHVARIVECYKDMCDLTHPGASSVWMWLHCRSDFEIELAPDQEETAISQFVVKYRKTFLELLTFAFNPAIVTLRVLNYFPIEHLHMPKLMSWNLSGIPLWQKCEADLTGVPPRVRVPLSTLKPNHPLHPRPRKRRG